MQILRKQTFGAVPWKNGGGITHEAVRVPPTGDAFRWRVSLAHIEASGPFSDFTGYQRKMVLLRGAGLTLEFGAGKHRELRKCGDWVAFDGATPVQCSLLDGPCVDLNLIVANSLTASVRVERCRDSIAAAASEGEILLILSVEYPLSLQDDAGETATLEPWDLALLEGGSARLDRISAASPYPPGAVFIATISQ